MAYRFTARAVSADLDGEVLQAGVAEGEDGSGFSLLFMGDTGEPSRQDVSLGFDTHCVVTPDQSTAYGCVREIALKDNLLTVSLDPDSLEDLELEDAQIEAVLEVPAEDIQQMREVLARVLTLGRHDARPTRVDL
jgi:hypothetical protein